MLERDATQWTSAWLACNERKNRYYDILPNERTRFKLEGCSLYPSTVLQP